jgi:hypothetical protein
VSDEAIDFEIGGRTPIPGVLHKVVLIKELHNVAVRKYMKIKGRENDVFAMYAQTTESKGEKLILVLGARATDRQNDRSM